MSANQHSLASAGADSPKATALHQDTYYGDGVHEE